MFHQASLKLGLDRAVLAHARNEQVTARPPRTPYSSYPPPCTLHDPNITLSPYHSITLSPYTMSPYRLYGQDEEAADRLDISAPSNKDKVNMSAKEIDELLKRGAYDVFREDDTDQREFLEVLLTS